MREWAMVCVWGLGVAGLAGCVQTHPIRVDSDYGPGIKLHGLGPNFAWRPGFESTWKEPTAAYYEVRTHVRDRIVRELEARGFNQATPETADFWIDYRVSSEKRGDPYNQLITYEMGMLVIHITDPQSRHGIWRGWAESRFVESATPEDRREAICHAVDEVFDRFPYRPRWVEETIVEGPVMEEVVVEHEPVPVTRPAEP